MKILKLNLLSSFVFIFIFVYIMCDTYIQPVKDEEYDILKLTQGEFSVPVADIIKTKFGSSDNHLLDARISYTNFQCLYQTRDGYLEQSL